MSDVIKNWATVKRGEVFKRLSSRPENWSFTGFCAHRHGACQLCETPISWQYELRNTDGRTLLVGSECVRWYYEAYMPDGLELALELLNKAYKVTKKEVVDGKLEEFRVVFPDLCDYLVGPTRRGYKDQRILCQVGAEGEPYRDEYIYVSKFRASLRRKGYLRADELKVIYTGYERARYGRAWLLQQQYNNKGEVSTNV